MDHAWGNDGAAPGGGDPWIDDPVLALAFGNNNGNNNGEDNDDDAGGG